jgi:HSP20 family protein
MVIRIAGTNQTPEAQQERNPLPSPFRMFEDFFNNWAFHTAIGRRIDSYKPPVDILEKGNMLLMRCELPGLDEKDLDLKIDGRTLTIQGERKQEPEGSGYLYRQIEAAYGAFSRSFDLPNSVDVDKISAAFNNGVLTITMPQKPEIQPRSIKVNARE